MLAEDLGPLRFPMQSLPPIKYLFIISFHIFESENWVQQFPPYFPQNDVTKSAEASWEVFLEDVTLDVSYKIQTVSKDKHPCK